MSYNDQLSANNEALASILTKVNNLPEAGSGSSGGESSGYETCTVVVNTPANVSIFAWGECEVGPPFNHTVTFPSASALVHTLPIEVTRTFANIPVGSVMVFYKSYSIKGAEISGDIEFSFAEDDAAGGSIIYDFAMCKCNGDGEITIQTN